jgi:spore germination cell wall hydrolase CwlJ-like protein
MMITAATCLAMAVYYEARGEHLDGQLAVAEVVINRVQSPDFPGTVCEVVKQDTGPKKYDCQFSFYCDGMPEDPKEIAAWSTAKDIADMALRGEVLDHGATFYHAVEVKPYWAKHFEFVGRIGDHMFYNGDINKKDWKRKDISMPRPRLRPVSN